MERETLSELLWPKCCSKTGAQDGFSHLNSFPEVVLQWFESQTLVPLRTTAKWVHWVSPSLIGHQKAVEVQNPSAPCRKSTNPRSAP